MAVSSDPVTGLATGAAPVSWSASKAVDSASAVHSRSSMEAGSVRRSATGPLRTIRSSISWASRTALSARRIRSTATACGEGGGVARGRMIGTTISTPRGGKETSPGGQPGTSARRRQLDSPSRQVLHARPGRRSVDAERGSTRARCQRARRQKRQTRNPVEGTVRVPRSGVAVLAPGRLASPTIAAAGVPARAPVGSERRRARATPIRYPGSPSRPRLALVPGFR